MLPSKEVVEVARAVRGVTQPQHPRRKPLGTTQQIDEFVYVAGQDDFSVARHGVAEGTARPTSRALR